LNAAEKVMDRADGPIRRIDPARWVPKSLALYFQAAILFALTGLLYGDILKHLVQNWLEDSNYSHAFLIPPFAAFLVWERRRAWMAKLVRPEFKGIYVIFGAMALLVAGTLGAELFLSRVSFVVLLGGLIVYFLGWQVAGTLVAPWLVLLLMVPLPVLVFNEIAFPLQMLASSLASSLLNLLHVPALREGSAIILPSITLNVVEACSGIRSLISLVTLAIFYGLLRKCRIGMRCMFVFFAIPTAVAANALRIVGAALLAEHVGPQFADGFFHTFSGGLIFALTVGVLVGLDAIGTRFAEQRVAT
jgi:exosortase